MNPEQKVLLARASMPLEATKITEMLNREAADGWRLQYTSTLANRGGGAIYTVPNAYYFHNHLLTLKKSDAHYRYECIMLTRNPKLEADIDMINSKMAEMNAQDYELVQTLQAISISPNENRPTIGTAGYVLIFERREE